MAGRPQRKVFCQGFTRAGLRQGLKIPCRMKGYPLSGGKVFKCKFHGYQNYDKFNRSNYSDEARIKQLSKLKQFRNYTDEQLKEYYYEKIKPRIINRGKSVYHRRKIGKRYDAFRDTRRQPVSFQLDEVLRVAKEKSRARSEDS